MKGTDSISWLFRIIGILIVFLLAYLLARYSSFNR